MSALVRVLQRAKTIYGERERFIGSCDYGHWAWRLRSPTVCHLQAGDPGKLRVAQSKSKGLRSRGLIVPVQRQENTDVFSHGQTGERIWPFSAFFFSLSLIQMGRCPLILRRVICFTQSTNSNANLFQIHSTDALGNNVLPAIVALLDPVRGWYKVTHHNIRDPQNSRNH